MFSDPQKWESTVQQLVSRICRRPVEKQSDEYSVAIDALQEAIEKFEPKKGKFLTFYQVVLKSRILDYYKQQANQRFRSVDMQDQSTTTWFTKKSLETYQEEQINERRKEEIMQLQHILAQYHLSLSDIENHRPKRKDAIKRCFDVSQKLIDLRLDQAFLDLYQIHVEQQKVTYTMRLQDIAEWIDTPIRFLQRNRIYLIGLLIVNREEFPIIQRYIGFSKIW